MKSVKVILAAAALFLGFSASAQDFSDDSKYGKWGTTVEERQANISASNYLKEAIDAKDFKRATEYFQQLLNNCPAASQQTFARGVTIYKNKAQRARSVEQKRMFIDSVLYIYDQRVVYFGNHSKNGKDYILFYLKLLCESVDHEGALRFSETIPYNEEMLATITDTNVDTVRSAIKVFSELGMVEITQDGTYFMTEVTGMIGSAADNDNANRQRRFRERQKQMALEDRYGDVTKNNESKRESKRVSMRVSVRVSVSVRFRTNVISLRQIGARGVR